MTVHGLLALQDVVESLAAELSVSVKPTVSVAAVLVQVYMLVFVHVIV